LGIDGLNGRGVADVDCTWDVAQFADQHSSRAGCVVISEHKDPKDFR
jgi:hypothetical protein